MANSTTASFPAALIMYTITGSVDSLISIPVNCWALWLIVSGSKSLFESEFLTLHVVLMEMAFSCCFLLTQSRIYFQSSALSPLINFYQGSSVVARALSQCHLCVDRYLAVVHPMIFIRYKTIRYRGTCLVAVWLGASMAGLANCFLPFDLRVVSLGTFLLLAPSLSIELFCSLSILRILRQPGPGDRSAHEKKEGNKQKIRAIRIICLALTMLLLNVAPFFFVSVPSRIGSAMNRIAVVYAVSSVGGSAQGLLFLSRAGRLPCKG